MRRTVEVTATCSLSFVIDDEAISEWDNARILEVLERRANARPPVYTEGATLDDLLCHLGVMLSVENRRMGSFDGWADFPESAAQGNPYGVDWAVESVHVRDGEEGP